MALFDPTDSDFLCCAEWHFGRLHGATFAPIIYSWARRISKKSGRFFVSIPKMAAFLNISEMACRSAVHSLTITGFFLKLKSANGEATAYRVVDHKEWAEAHPGQCAEKLALPWQEEKPDELWLALWQASGGKFTPFKNFKTSVRKIASDAEIVRCFAEDFWPHDSHAKAGMAGRFKAVLKARVAAAGLPTGGPRAAHGAPPGYPDTPLRIS